MIIWLNGELVEEQQAVLSPADRGLLLADGLFETLRAASHGLIDLPRHMKRLQQGAHYFGIPLQYSQAQFDEACRAVLEANGLANQTASLRITLTRGPGPRGLAPPSDPKPTVIVSAGAATKPPSALSVITATTRRNEMSPTSCFKTLAYTDNVLAKRQAQIARADDALLLNGKDRYACASAANLWVVKNATVTTPPISEGALPGIVRQRLIDLASDLDNKVIEAPITRSELEAADEIFVTNSLIGICPVAKVDGKKVAGGKVTAHFFRVYKKTVPFD